jgi:hypothetical protein
LLQGAVPIWKRAYGEAGTPWQALIAGNLRWPARAIQSSGSTSAGRPGRA